MGQGSVLAAGRRVASKDEEAVVVHGVGKWCWKQSGNTVMDDGITVGAGGCRDTCAVADTAYDTQ